ncbi:fimbrial assembly protein [Paraburkholderia bonniea]|nr:fimbrial assembly protein [Paraburkholderia bonniea]WJF93898.1 fimbrial assembly protein [Paraburkholderia bonniea]
MRLRIAGSAGSGAAGTVGAVGVPRVRRRPDLPSMWVGGFNLLPYRQRDQRRSRKRCLAQGLVAFAAGCAAVLALAVWQTVEQRRDEARRVALDDALAQLALPLREHTRLMQEAAAQRQRAVQSVAHSVPLVRLRTLLDAMGRASVEGVSVVQVQMREHDAKVYATALGHLPAAAWLKKLSALPGVKSVEMSELRRVNGRAQDAATTDAAMVQLTARLRWDMPASSGTARPANGGLRGAP